jgi:hypothetical protein
MFSFPSVFLALCLFPTANAYDVTFGSSSAQDNDGKGLLVADLNNDGHDDIAAQHGHRIIITYSVPGEVWFADGPTINQSGGTVYEAGDDFGEELAAADFDRDGYMDIAVGVPNENWGRPADNGLVQIYRGTADGGFVHGTNIVPPGSDAYDRFGTSIATGDFNDDGWPDLAASSPGESEGRVYVLWGGPSPSLGWSLPSFQRWDTWNVYDDLDVAAHNAWQFGATIVAGDFDGDGIDDLAMAAKQADCDASQQRCGYVSAMYGSKSGLSDGHGFPVDRASPGDRRLRPADLSNRETAQWFSPKLASGDFDGDDVDDLAYVVYPDVAGSPGHPMVLHGIAQRGLLGSFRTGPDLPGDSDIVTGLAMADLNHDGNEELLLARTEHNSLGGDLAVMYHTGSNSVRTTHHALESTANTGDLVTGHFGTCDVSFSIWTGRSVDCTGVMSSIAVENGAETEILTPR